MSDERGAKSANIFDVARLAGVSHQTVSRVLNDLPNVRPATRARVEQAITQLRYSPSPAARALVTRRTRTIGLVTPGSADFGPTSIAMHFTVAARAERYSVDTVTSPDPDPASVRSAVETLLRQRVDAIVLVVTDVGVLEVVRGLDLSVPLVAAAATQRRHPHLVSIDQYRGARSAVRHLAELGHSRILHVAGPPRNPDALERVRGWRDELAARRLVAEEPRNGDWSAASGYELGRELDLGSGTAVFVGNDHMAIGLLSALRGRGLSVPEDISVVGFDDVPEAPYLMPPLTTVRQDFRALGELMMQKVLLAVEEPESLTEDTPIATHLIVRESARALG
ncbi:MULTISPECIES: LacI family DNA-binding transcriptional regulator [Microbacterium]|uniref:LacI family transcriptional regulator n=1 Tax=Microbacterium wangchenii TaxID=2541726 RepID=A0ABX5SNA3_9MICO|nr:MULTISPECIES: LacI family DNA-binding transcriptional regulator [Microbacterium]MCK6066297.1 LacI family DNA-binding transcriptional regulator [Microbacterium sp. EYE_512]QBR87272.1 LacI family transcriptional regulator [Microbacterium wangchenii]TFV84625.1 LacI family transcriptional regulator [Microbacterium sp. dk485]TXK14593.1 LacI family transcriptional regulator [Microbacterium wangchenii]